MFYFYWTLDSNLPTCSETSLGHIDHVAIEKELNGSLKKRESCVKYTPEDRYKVGKYGSENVQLLLSVNSRGSKFAAKIPIWAHEIKVKGHYPRTSYPKETDRTTTSTWKYCKIDAMVQKYITASSNRGTSTAKALISRNPGYAGQIDLESSSWTQSFVE